MADQSPSDAPSLPPIPMIPFQGPPPSIPASTPTPIPATPPVASPAPATPKGPLYEDPDLVKVPGAS